jgi:tRNA threonylcarbamoyladenosine biosynthesis protein TsaB
MIILTIRTDRLESEIGIYDNNDQIVYEVWHAHRELAETILKKIEEILSKSNIKLSEIEGVVCYKGPGSFTGLRIGLSVGNALAYAQNIPIVSKEDPDWLENGIKDILAGRNDKIAIPEYGADAITTKQRK